jgi:hypothetical protein
MFLDIFNPGPKTDRSTVSHSKSAASDKMESELEMNKANKPSPEKPEDVAGRENKGVMTGLLDKITSKPGAPRVKGVDESALKKAANPT